MDHRTLVIKVPLTDEDPVDILDQINAGDFDPTELVIEREADVVVLLEVAD